MVKKLVKIKKTKMVKVRKPKLVNFIQIYLQAYWITENTWREWKKWECFQIKIMTYCMGYSTYKSWTSF